MKILKTKYLTAVQEQEIDRLWNEEYPKKLENRFKLLLVGIPDYNHHLLINAFGKIIGWAVDFERENETWFSIIISSDHQKQGYGNLLITSLKEDFNNLCGWVIDHNNDKKSDGTNYISPLPFYFKNEFDIIADKRIETDIISAVKINWKK